MVPGFWVLGFSGSGSEPQDVMRRMGVEDVAELVERDWDGGSRYPEEWKAFVDTRQKDAVIEGVRRQGDALDPLVNRPGGADPDALARLRDIVARLRYGRT